MHCFVVLVDGDVPVYFQVAAFPCERSVDSGFAGPASGVAVGDDLPVYFQAAVASCESSADYGFAYPVSDSSVKDDLAVLSGAVSCERSVGSGFAEPVSDVAVASEGPRFHWIDLLASRCTESFFPHECYFSVLQLVSAMVLAQHLYGSSLHLIQKVRRKKLLIVIPYLQDPRVQSGLAFRHLTQLAFVPS